MNKIFNETKQINDWETLFQKYLSKNDLKQLNTSLISTEAIEQFQNHVDFLKEKGPVKSKKKWTLTEKKFLYLCMNCLSVQTQKTFNQFDDQLKSTFTSIFSYKNKYSTLYEIEKKCTVSNQTRRRWPQEEENLLQIIVKKSRKVNQWNELARQLFIHSEGLYFRQGKHCRERFYRIIEQKESKRQEKKQKGQRSQQPQFLEFGQGHPKAQYRSSRKLKSSDQRDRTAKSSKIKLLSDGASKNKKTSKRKTVKGQLKYTRQQEKKEFASGIASKPKECQVFNIDNENQCKIQQNQQINKIPTNKIQIRSRITHESKDGEQKQPEPEKQIEYPLRHLQKKQQNLMQSQFTPQMTPNLIFHFGMNWLSPTSYGQSFSYPWNRPGFL